MNYKNHLLIPIVKEKLPNGDYGWQAVAAAYQEAAKEDDVRNSHDVKKYWVQKLCNGTKKPTGRTGGKDDQVHKHKCIAIEKLILIKTDSGVLGLSDSDDDGGVESG